MAALLKKRALAEYSLSRVVTEPADVARPKKLRLTKKSSDYSERDTGASVSTSIASLSDEKPPEQIFCTLSSIAACMPVNEADISVLHKKLLQLLHTSKSSALKTKCLSVMQLLNPSKNNAGGLAAEICDILMRENSNAVLTQGLTSVLKLSQIANDAETENRVVSFARKLLQRTDGKLAVKCLEALGILTLFSDTRSLIDLLQLVECYTHGGDPRVRSTAFRIMLQVHKKGAPLRTSLYSDVVHCLNDDYESVKLAALKLIYAISQSHPEEQVSQEGIQIRLIDDAFAHICSAINDPSLQVRVLAAQLLGQMPMVGSTFLEQTLDKKLMSDMRRKRSAHERNWEKVKAGEWSSGKQWADDAPKELIDADSISLISGGAAGAFIHGLEDEYMEVRSAAVDSLCRLAMLHKGFANLALDFLVDMFNDEIEEVRLKAIDSLGCIGSHITLWEDHLDIILSVLEDSSLDIREALHRVLGVSHMMTRECVKMCVQSLLENLRRRPSDKNSIWKALQGIGLRHSWTVLPLVPQLLSMHAFFDTAETDPEDPIYVSVLILVFNAAKDCSTMLSLFEEKFIRHYRYLRDTLPHLVPELGLGQEMSNLNEATVESDDAGPSGFRVPPPAVVNGNTMLRTLIDKLKGADNLNDTAKLSLSRLILRDVKRLSKVDEHVSGVAKLTALYIRAHIVYNNSILGSNSWKQLSQNSPNDNLKRQIHKFLQLCLKMQYGFNGLTPEEFAVVLQLKLRALAFQLVYIVKGSNASALATCQNLLEQTENVQKYMEDHGLYPDSFARAMFKIVDSLEEPKPGTLSNMLIPLFEEHCLPIIHFKGFVQEVVATIVEPAGGSDTPLELTSGLLLGIPLHCEINNLFSEDLIRIRVKYPDEEEHLIRPKPSDFKPVIESPGVTRLLTKITVSHKSWTEPCPVVLSVVQDLSGPETNYNRKMLAMHKAVYTLQLSVEKHVLVAPRTPRKGV